MRGAAYQTSAVWALTEVWQWWLGEILSHAPFLLKHSWRFTNCTHYVSTFIFFDEGNQVFPDHYQMLLLYRPFKDLIQKLHEKCNCQLHLHRFVTAVWGNCLYVQIHELHFFKYDLIYRTTVIEFMEHVAKNNHLPCQHLDHC